MTYTDLIKAVSTDANCSQTLVKQIIETLSNHVAREVRAGVPLRIPALGTFPLQSVRNASAATPLRVLPS